MKAIIISELIKKNNLKEEYIKKLYIDSNKTVLEISKHLQLSTRVTHRLLNFFNLKCLKKTLSSNYTLERIQKKLKNNNYSINDVINDYQNNLFSLPDILKKYGLLYNDTTFILKKFNIYIRSLKEANKLSQKQKKYLQTMNKKYGDGIINVSQLEGVKEKKRQTFLKNYGVDNIRKSKDFYLWLDDFMMKKYGQLRINDPYKVSIALKKRWQELTQEERDNLYNKTLGKVRRGSVSNLELNFQNHLNQMGVDYQHSFRLGKYLYDYKIIGTNILIEINGDFWHANPQKYKKNDILNFPGKKKPTAESIWIKDKKRIDFAKKNNYTVLTIWENYLINANSEDILKLLYNEIKINQKNTKRI